VFDSSLYVGLGGTLLPLASVPRKLETIGRSPSPGKATVVRFTLSTNTRVEPVEIMEDVLRQRLIRKIESLPEEQVYQVLDYIEFLDIKYGAVPDEASGLQKFAEGIQDKMRERAMSPSTIRGAFQIISTADKVFSSVSDAGSRLMEELTGSGEGASEDSGPAEDDGEEETSDDKLADGSDADSTQRSGGGEAEGK